MNLTFDSFFNTIETNKLVVIDMYATYCEPCQRFMKIIPRVETAIEGKAVFGKVDVDAEPVLKQMYEIKKVPAFIFFKDGHEVFRQEGKIMTISEISKKVTELC